MNKTYKFILIAVCLLSLATFSGNALADIVYVDALGGVGGNTVNAGTGSATDWYNTSNAADGLWRLRTGFANNDSFALGTPGNEVYEATGTTSGEDVMPIITTISGLTPGSLYDVNVVYWSSHDNTNNQSWNVRAGFSLDNILFYDRLGLNSAYSWNTDRKNRKRPR